MIAAVVVYLGGWCACAAILGAFSDHQLETGKRSPEDKPPPGSIAVLSFAWPVWAVAALFVITAAAIGRKVIR